VGKVVKKINIDDLVIDERVFIRSGLNEDAVQRYMDAYRAGKENDLDNVLPRLFLRKYSRRSARSLHENLLKFGVIPLFLPKGDGVLTFVAWVNLRSMMKHFGSFKDEELVWWNGKPWFRENLRQRPPPASEAQIATKYCGLLEEKGWRIIRNDVSKRGPDIVAKSERGVIVAECKRSTSLNAIYQALGQLLFYAIDYPNATLQIVTPSPVASEVRSKLSFYNVETVVVNVNGEGDSDGQKGSHRQT